MPLIQKKLSSGKIVMIEVSSISEDNKISKDKKVMQMIDEAFDKLVQNEITEYSSILVGAFENLKQQPIPPKKASAEFGLQVSGEGNVYLAKIAAQANFKVLIEWEL
jgi:hypothetical protein